MQIAELVAKIVAKRTERGFVTDPLKIHVLLTEEIGEVAAELKRTWSKNYSEFSRDKLGEEIADVFCLLAALANEFDIDIERSVKEKFFEADESRTWRSAAQPVHARDRATPA